MIKFWQFLFLILFLGGLFWLIFINKEEMNNITDMLKDSKNENNLSIRKAFVSGQFYSSNKNELFKMINNFLEKAELPEMTDQIKGLIVPHAGYDFSGQTAAYAFKLIQKKDIERVILIGSSHQEYLEGAIMDGNDIWKTPLGQVNLDTDLRDKLIEESSLFKVDLISHMKEHSLEVEIPFLEVVLNDFKILPILIGHKSSEEELNEISDVLSKYIDKKTLVIASSDMSHYPDYENANYADKKVLEAILTGNVSILKKTIEEIENENISNLNVCLCAQKAVELFMKLMDKINADNIKLLNYANSGDLDIGDKLRVVGYSSFAFSEKLWDFNFSESQKQKLLEITKTSVEKYVLENKLAEFNIEDELLSKKLGAFVTLKKNNQLRGCIGLFESNLSLYKVVSQMAVAAAVKDNRFSPVEKDELEDLEYEISVLSPLRKINSWEEIEIGKHGVQIQRGNQSGVFLPQVATENNWDLEEFMNNLCEHKAGLEKDCWKKEETDIYIFTVEIIK